MGTPRPRGRLWLPHMLAPSRGSAADAVEFAEIVRAVLDLTDRLAPALGEPEREAMRRHFLTTSRYEWMFWEMAYRLESWPI